MSKHIDIDASTKKTRPESVSLKLGGKDPVFFICIVMIVFGLILEPSPDKVSLFGFTLPEVCYFRRFFDIS